MPVMMTASQFFFSARARTFRVGMRPRDTPCGGLPQPWQSNTPNGSPSKFLTFVPLRRAMRVEDASTDAWKQPRARALPLSERVELERRRPEGEKRG